MFLFFSMFPLHSTEVNPLIALFPLLLRDILEILHLPFHQTLFVRLFKGAYR